MRYEIILSPEAERDYKRLKARIRSEVRDALELHLRHEPTKVAKSRIKRLRGLSQPQYRLCVGDIQAFYDVAPNSVLILAIILKVDVDRWLHEAGKST